MFWPSGSRAQGPGGSIHVIVKQPARDFYTNTPLRAGLALSSDVAKMIEVADLPRNGDDPEAVWSMQQRVRPFRQRFHKPVVLEMLWPIGRHGHNEGDERPSRSRSVQGDAIPAGRSRSTRQVGKEGVSHRRVASARERWRAHRKRNARVGQYKAEQGRLRDGGSGSQHRRQATSGVCRRDWRCIDTCGMSVTESSRSHGFQHPPPVKRLLDSRQKILWIDRGRASIGGLAGARLRHAVEGWLKGQGFRSGCGARHFSQRHSVLFDQKDGERYTYVSPRRREGGVRGGQRLLSEERCWLRVGYHWHEPKALTLWKRSSAIGQRRAVVVRAVHLVRRAQVAADVRSRYAPATWL